jgi:hypothetical protein
MQVKGVESLCDAEMGGRYAEFAQKIGWKAGSGLK